MAGFSALFYLLRNSEYYNDKLLFEDLQGIPWLYSVVALIFSIIAAFTIQKQWGQWINLMDSVKSEVESLERLLRWARNLPEEIRLKFSAAIAEYLDVIIREGLEKESAEGAADKILSSLNSEFPAISEQKPELMPTTFAIFAETTRHRENRIRNSAHRMPPILRSTLLFSAGLVMFLSLLIGVNNAWLDYIFTGSIASLVYIIYVVIDDLDNPLRPGTWHLTTREHERLRSKIAKQKI